MSSEALRSTRNFRVHVDKCLVLGSLSVTQLTWDIYRKSTNIWTSCTKFKLSAKTTLKHTYSATCCMSQQCSIMLQLIQIYQDDIANMTANTPLCEKTLIQQMEQTRNYRTCSSGACHISIVFAVYIKQNWNIKLKVSQCQIPLQVDGTEHVQSLIIGYVWQNFKQDSTFTITFAVMQCLILH